MAQLASASNVVSHWHHPIENFQASTMEFYAAVERALVPRQIPGIAVSRIEWREGGLLSARREYLRVRREKLVFDICAAPFGTGYFFSWWLAEIPPGFGLLRLVGILFGMFIAFNFLEVIFATLVGGLSGVLAAFPLAVLALAVISWALGKAVHDGVFGPGAEEALIGTPLLGWLYVRLFAPFTYYKIDTTMMFQSAVHAAVLEVVDQTISAKGARSLTEFERRPIMREFYQR